MFNKEQVIQANENWNAVKKFLEERAEEYYAAQGNDRYGSIWFHQYTEQSIKFKVTPLYSSGVAVDYYFDMIMTIITIEEEAWNSYIGRLKAKTLEAKRDIDASLEVEEYNQYLKLHEKYGKGYA